MTFVFVQLVSHQRCVQPTRLLSIVWGTVCLPSLVACAKAAFALVIRAPVRVRCWKGAGRGGAHLGDVAIYCCAGVLLLHCAAMLHAARYGG